LLPLSQFAQPAFAQGIEVIRTHLVRIVGAADSRTQDRAAFAVQEVLSALGCTPQSVGVGAADSRGRRNWAQLQSVHTTVSPFLASRYQMQTVRPEPAGACVRTSRRTVAEIGPARRRARGV
jgi:hypothetical protein